MLGINYESSDEEDVVPAAKLQETVVKDTPIAAPVSPKPDLQSAEILQAHSEPISGPAAGPTASPPPVVEPSTEEAGPGSPYTATRAAIHSLTLPTVPNFNIPASPPGSPPQRSTKKFAQFLELKKKGQHFNQKLENSTVLRDPSHLQRLMDFAAIHEDEQYASTLPDGVAVPTKFPMWAYVEELKESQRKIAKAKEEEKVRQPRDRIEFVPAARSGASSGTGTPLGKGKHESAAERVMAGLDRQSSSKRKELERRGGRTDSLSRGRWRSRSRSPKRRRSKSRDRR